LPQISQSGKCQRNLGRARIEATLIFYSANSQAIERMWKSAPEKRLGTTFRMIS